MGTSVQFPAQPSGGMIAILWAATLLLQAYPLAYSQQYQAPAAATVNEEQAPIPADQLDSLVAPIALYPDPLLAQTLAASTYPLEVIQLEQWYANNKYLKDKALADAVAKQPWDPSVQALVAFPDVFQRMADNIQWTTDLGNAFLAQQSDVMDAIQRMRAKAQGTGNLKSSAQQKVESQTGENGQQAIVIEQASPDVVYVPSYDPQMVYGPAPPAYPYYPYTYPGYYAGMGLAFGAGLAVGGIWANNWGNCDWKHGDVNINNNNNFNRNVNRNVNRTTVTGQGNTWQHNPQHRGNAPYGNRQTANRYGGTARGEAGARAGAGVGSLAGGGAGARSVGSGIGGGNRTGSIGGQNSGAGNRYNGGVGAGNISGSNRSGGAVGANRGPGASTMPASRGGGANSIGNRSVSSGSGFGSSSNAFGGGGFNGSAARSAGNRGGASMGGGGSNRAAGGGGGRAAGGARGGGGGRRR